MANIRKTELLEKIISQIGDFTRDAIIICEAEPFEEPGPKIIWCNKAFTDITGYSKEEVIGNSPRFLQGPETDLETVKKIGFELRQWKTIRADILNYRKDGSQFWSELSIMPVSDEKGWFHYWVSVQRDVTDRKERELSLEKLQNQLTGSDDALRVMNDRYHVTTRGSSVGLWDWDVVTNDLYWSKKFMEIVGITKDEFKPDFAEFADRLHPEDRDCVMEAISDHLEKRTVYDIRYRLLRNSGEYRWIHACGQAIWNSANEPIRMAGSVQDITDQVAYHDKLLEAQLKAEASNEAKSRFLANMSHELRTPLNGIMGLAQMLQLRDLSEQDAEYVDLILSSGNTLLRLLNDLLDVSRIEMGQAELAFEPINFKSILDQVFNHLQLNNKREVSVIDEVRLSRELTYYGDNVKILQILTNLVSNAVKFTHEGQVSIKISSRDNEGVDIYVEDTGIGISGDNQGQIFDRFTQVDDSYSKSFQGAGLGLSIVKSLVDLMKGTIELSSELGQGSTFKVFLPLSAKVTELKQPNSTKDYNPYRVLVAEDNEANTAVFKALLNLVGVDGIYCGDGEAAIQQFESEEFDAIFLDIGMPKLDGVEVLKKIKSMKRNMPPVYAVTGHIQQADLKTYDEVGFTEVIPKPIDANYVIDILRTLKQKKNQGVPLYHSDPSALTH